MLRSVLLLWLLSVFSVTVVAHECPSGFSVPGCTSKITSTSKSTSARQTPATSGGNPSIGASTTNAGGEGGGTTGSPVTSAQAQQTTGAATSTRQSASTHTSNGPSSSGLAGTDSGHPASTTSGLTSAQKAGIGVGVGLGIPLIAGAIALFFILRRRKSNRYSSGTSAAQLRDQPAMSSGAPALAGIAAMGHSSKHSLPRTSSQHSLANVPPPPPVPVVKPPSRHSLVQPPSQHSLARAPSQQSAAPSLPEHDNFISPPPAYYEEAPSPMEEHHEPVSPVSPISPMGSRPPSPMNDHDR